MKPTDNAASDTTATSQSSAIDCCRKSDGTSARDAGTPAVPLPQNQEDLVEPPASEFSALDIFERITDARFARQKVFGNTLFVDPAWDLFLELAQADLAGRMLSTKALCLATAVPVSTAWRHIDRMIAKGMFMRVVDENDNRRRYIQLTAKGQALASQFTATVATAYANRRRPK